MINPFQTDASPFAADTRMWSQTGEDTPDVGRLCRYPGDGGLPTGRLSQRWERCGVAGELVKVYEMARSYTRERVWVSKSALSPYPSSPIPDPSARPLALLDAAYDYGGPG